MPTNHRNRNVSRPVLEMLDGRLLLASLSPDQLEAAYNLTRFGQSTAPSIYYVPGETGTTPYSANGAGQTIAIIEQGPDGVASTDPNVFSDLTSFDSYLNVPPLQLQNFQQITFPQTGNSTPATDQETELDVEWAHAIAPAAHILLVEANAFDSSQANTKADPEQAAFAEAAGYAADASENGFPVTAVSMSYSFDGPSGYSEPSASVESALDAFLTTPTGHAPVAFFAASGDYTPGESNLNTISWPSVSPNVVSVGGTTLAIGASGVRSGEVAWNDGNSGAGAGISMYESRPAYQYPGVYVNSSTGNRQYPDVSYNADPDSGVYVYGIHTDPIYGVQTGFYNEGGTSLATPLMAATEAVLNEGLNDNGITSFTTSGFQTLLYSLNHYDEFSKPSSQQPFNFVPLLQTPYYEDGFQLNQAGLGTPNGYWFLFDSVEGFKNMDGTLKVRVLEGGS